MALEPAALRSRRALLAGAVGGMAAVAAQVLGRAAPAAAGGANLVLGVTNNQSDGRTGLVATPPEGAGVYGLGVTDGGLDAFRYRAAIAGHGKTRFATGVFGYHEQAGNGVTGMADGSEGWGVLGIANASTGATGRGVRGLSESTGAGVEGISENGRGGQFDGIKAAIRLMPRDTLTHPTKGLRGDLYVDRSGRLWYCRTGGTSAIWKQLA